MNPVPSMAERAQQVLTQLGTTPSPCNSVCTVSPRDGLCQGCYRSLDEIANWSTLSNEDKRQVWSRILERTRSTTE